MSKQLALLNAVCARNLQCQHIVDMAAEAHALLARMEADGFCPVPINARPGAATPSATSGKRDTRDGRTGWALMLKP